MGDSDIWYELYQSEANMLREELLDISVELDEAYQYISILENRIIVLKRGKSFYNRLKRFIYG